MTQIQKLSLSQQIKPLNERQGFKANLPTHSLLKIKIITKSGCTLLKLKLAQRIIFNNTLYN